MQEIANKLAAYIIERFDIGADPEFNNDAHLFDLGFVDSFGAMEIITFLEGEFSVRITQKDITLYPMNTVNEISAIIAGKLG